MNSEKNQRLKAELGDVYFSLAQACRHLGFDPETIACDGNQKFLERFRVLEELARERKVDVTRTSREDLESLWQKAKACL